MAGILHLMAGSFPDNAYLQLCPWEHILIGGFAFGTVFMATDPVTAT